MSVTAMTSSGRGAPMANLIKHCASFYLSTGGQTAMNNVKRQLTINETSVNTQPGIFALASNQVTVSKPMNAKFSWDVSFNTGSSSRSAFDVWLERDGVEVPGTRSMTYQRGYDSGDTATGTLIIPVLAGQVYRLVAQRVDGGATTGYQNDNGTRLTIEEK